MGITNSSKLHTAICSLLGISERKITRLSLCLAVDKTPMLTITQFIGLADGQDPKLVTQEFEISPLGTAKEESLGDRDIGSHVETSGILDTCETYSLKAK